MNSIFPKDIQNLPEVDLGIRGGKAYLSQGPDHQILYMSFEEDVELPLHAHEAQYGIVLEGRIDLNIGGEMKSYYKGDRFYIEAGVEHFGKIYAGYSDITFFNEQSRYKLK